MKKKFEELVQKTADKLINKSIPIIAMAKLITRLTDEYRSLAESYIILTRTVKMHQQMFEEIYAKSVAAKSSGIDLSLPEPKQKEHKSN